MEWRGRAPSGEDDGGSWLDGNFQSPARSGLDLLMQAEMALSHGCLDTYADDRLLACSTLELLSTNLSLFLLYCKAFRTGR